jgi:hypothetical protein
VCQDGYLVFLGCDSLCGCALQRGMCILEVSKFVMEREDSGQCSSGLLSVDVGVLFSFDDYMRGQTKKEIQGWEHTYPLSFTLSFFCCSVSELLFKMVDPKLCFKLCLHRFSCQ